MYYSNFYKKKQRTAVRDRSASQYDGVGAQLRVAWGVRVGTQLRVGYVGVYPIERITNTLCSTRLEAEK